MPGPVCPRCGRSTTDPAEHPTAGPTGEEAAPGAALTVACGFCKVWLTFDTDGNLVKEDPFR